MRVSSSKMYTSEKVVPRAEMVILLKPLFRIGQWFGVFPLELNEDDPDNGLYQKKCSVNYFRSVLIFCLATAYLLFHLISMAISIWSGLSIIEVIGQSLWFQGSIMSYLVSLTLLTCPQSMIDLYTKDWRSVERDCGQVFTSPNVKRFTRNMFLFYAVLGVASALTVGYHSYAMPLYPAYVLHYVQMYKYPNFTSTSPVDGGRIRNWAAMKHNFSDLEIWIHSACQTWFVLWKWIGSAMMDCSLCLYGYVIGVTMTATLNNVNGVLETRDRNEEAQVFCQEPSSPVSEICATGKLSNGTDVVSYSNNSVPTVDALGTRKINHVVGDAWNHEQNRNETVPESQCANKMMVLLNEFQEMSQLVSQVNRATGPLLLVEFGQLIVMICALSFLPIKYWEDFEWRNAILFGGNAFVYTLRLVMLTICLGDVYPVGVEVNLRIAKFMISEAKKLDPAFFNPIMGHLNVFSANPICFNAWGFFPITRGTLLASLSVISTYIVVLSQMS